MGSCRGMDASVGVAEWQRGVAWEAVQGSETSVAWRGGVVYGAANTRGLGTDVSVVVGLPGRACPCRVEVDGAQCPRRSPSPSCRRRRRLTPSWISRPSRTA